MTFAYVVDPHGKVLASSARGPEIANDLSALPQVAALIAPSGTPRISGTDSGGEAVLAASSTGQSSAGSCCSNSRPRRPLARSAIS